MLLLLCPGSYCSSEALWLLLTAGALLRVRFLMLEFLTCLRIKFCKSQLPPSRVPRPASIHCRDCTFIAEWLWFTFTLPWLFGPIKLKSPPSSTDPSLSLLSPPYPSLPQLCANAYRWKDSHLSYIFSYDSYSICNNLLKSPLDSR